MLAQRGRGREPGAACALLYALCSRDTPFCLDCLEPVQGDGTCVSRYADQVDGGRLSNSRQLTAWDSPSRRIRLVQLDDLFGFVLPLLRVARSARVDFQLYGLGRSAWADERCKCSMIIQIVARGRFIAVRRSGGEDFTTLPPRRKACPPRFSATELTAASNAIRASAPIAPVARGRP